MFRTGRISGIFLKYSESILQIPVLMAIRQGLAYMMPLILLGSVALVLMSLPIPAYQNMMEGLFGASWKDLFRLIQDGTYGVMSIFMSISISYAYAAEHRRNTGSPIIAVLVSVASFIAVSGISRSGFTLTAFGVTGMFMSILTAVLSSLLFHKLCTVSFLKVKPVLSDGANSVFSAAMTAIVPACLTVSVFALFNQALVTLLEVSSIFQLISDGLTAFFANIKSPVASGFLFMFLVHLFWMFGMHGSNILEPVAQSIFVPALTANAQLVASGGAPTAVFSKAFFDAFILMGGCGTAVCLVLAIFIIGKHKNQRDLAKMSAAPVLFNINELIVFGLPVVLNPIYLLPFLGVPLLLTATSFLAVSFGLVPYTIHMVEWTTPIFLSGYTATGSVAGSILQLFNLALGTMCYIPFVRLAEQASQAQMKLNLEKIYSEYTQITERNISSLLSRNDYVGSMSRALTVDLEDALHNGGLKLFYQPQLDYAGRIIGCEALLRWEHKYFGYIQPPFIIALAEEAYLIDKLGYWILDTACTDLKRMNEAGIFGLRMAVNVSAFQLEGENFSRDLQNIIRHHGINPQFLEIEITEQTALTGSRKITDALMGIKELGVKLAMDDFGMGHSSLMYLKEFSFDTIKLDGSLIRTILENKSCLNIVSSIVTLGKSLNYEVIAEFVEKQEQRLILHDLGCERYQGYLFSRALPYEQILQFIAARSKYIPIPVNGSLEI